MQWTNFGKPHCLQHPPRGQQPCQLVHHCLHGQQAAREAAAPGRAAEPQALDGRSAAEDLGDLSGAGGRAGGGGAWG